VPAVWLFGNLLVTGLIATVCALVIWPTAGLGHRMLVRWGLADPTEPQVRTATGYLRRRRLLYVVCWLLLPAVAVATADVLHHRFAAQRYWGVLASILAAMLLAELVAALRRPRTAVRTAVLSRRLWSDLVPWWAAAAYLGLLGLVAFQAVAVVAARSWAAAAVAVQPPGRSAGAVLAGDHGWLALASAGAGLAAVLGVVLLAVRRPAVPDPEVDAVLRTRTARVTVGVGIGLALGLLNQTNSQVYELRVLWPGSGVPNVPPPPALLDLAGRVDGFGMLAAFVLGLIAWREVASPAPRRPAPAAAPA